MMRLALILIVALCASCHTEPPRPKPETLVEGGYDEQEMALAIERAHSEVDTIVAALADSSGSDFGVKVPITEMGVTEHFWLTDVSYRDGRFTGTIGNDPGLVTNVAFGDTMTVGRGELSDWIFMRNGKMHGNYTLRPLLITLPEEQAAQFRALFAEP